MKTARDTNHSGRTAWATILLSFWFLIVGVPAFCAAIPVDVLWAGMFDNSGQPLEGGKIYTYAAGTTASKTTYIDSAKVTAAANPIVLDAYGRAQVYADGAYKFVIKNSDDVTLITIDNLEYVSSQNPSTLNTTTFSASSATIGSITALLGTLVNMTISSATITLANIVSPNISNASMTGALYSPSVTNGTFTGGIFNGGTISPATFTLPANATVATPTVATAYVNKGYVDAALSTFSGVQYFKADPYPATGATTLFTTIVAPSGVEQAVTGMSFALSNTSTTATRTYLITGSYLVRMLSTDTMELLKMDFRDDLGNSYDTVYAQMMNNVYDIIGYTYSYTACKTAAYVQIGPSTTRTFYLYQEPATATATYHVFGKTDLADAFRIVGW